MKSLNNPFITYGYKGAEYFCDRKVETRKMIDALNNERNITLIAPRRIGKTGLIHHVFSQIREEQPDVHCIYIDIFATKNLEQLIQLLARNVIGKLDSPTHTVLRKISEFFINFRPTVTFDATSGMPTFSLDIAQGQQEQSLQRIFEYLEESGKRCYIALDEFQQITDYPETNTEALLRSYIQFMSNVYFIFAGSQQHMMTEMFLSAKKPFYQSSQIITLGEIDETAYYEFASHLFEQEGINLLKDAFHYLYESLDGQTWYLQSTMNRMYAIRPEIISQAEVDLSIAELINEQEVAFENYLSSLTSNQRDLLIAIANERQVKSPMANTFKRKYHLPAVSSIKMALAALIEKQMVYKYHDNYIVYDRFFAKWLRDKVLI